jgi:rare lipoprotein A
LLWLSLKAENETEERGFRHSAHNQKEIMMIRILLFTLSLIAMAAPAYADQEVTATWYGNELSGHRTASGEMFNPSGMTAAHRSLPFGTCLVVGNPKTGKSVAVRVNDRGPFNAGLTLDLSAGAARAIGMRSTERVTMRHC